MPCKEAACALVFEPTGGFVLWCVIFIKIKHACIVAFASGDTLRMPAPGGLLPLQLGAWAPRPVVLQSLCAAVVRRLLASVHARIG